MKTVNVEGARLSADALAVVKEWQESGYIDERLNGLSSVQDFLTDILIDRQGYGCDFCGTDLKGMLIQLMQLKEELAEFRCAEG